MTMSHDHVLDPLYPLRVFVIGMTRLVERTHEEGALVAGGSALLAELIADDRWLPEACAVPHPDRYQQYLLHCDPLERFSVVSFVWGPGQRTPIHDHMVWGLVGMLRGRELCQPYRCDAAGRWVADGPELTLLPGMIEAVSPTIGDVHVVANGLPDQASISIHVYGGNIGGIHRSVYTEDGERKPFVSGYSNTHLPNLWDRSKDTPAP